MLYGVPYILQENFHSHAVLSKCRNRSRSLACHKNTNHYSVFFVVIPQLVNNNSVIASVDDNGFVASDDFLAVEIFISRSQALTIVLEVALLYALDGVTFPKYEKTYSEIMLECSSLTLSRCSCLATSRTFFIVIYFRPSMYNYHKLFSVSLKQSFST